MELQKTPIKMWLASKTAMEHYLVQNEKFQINQRSKEYASFVAEFENHKNQHHADMVRVFSYLTFKELLVVSAVNRRLYIVSGDLSLLKMHSQSKTADIGRNHPNNLIGFSEQLQKPYDQKLDSRDLKEYIYTYQLIDQAPNKAKQENCPTAPPSGSVAILEETKINV